MSADTRPLGVRSAAQRASPTGRARMSFVRRLCSRVAASGPSAFRTASEGSGTTRGAFSGEGGASNFVAGEAAAVLGEGFGELGSQGHRNDRRTELSTQSL